MSNVLQRMPPHGVPWVLWCHLRKTSIRNQARASGLHLIEQKGLGRSTTGPPGRPVDQETAIRKLAGTVFHTNPNLQFNHTHRGQEEQTGTHMRGHINPTPNKAKIASLQGTPADAQLRPAAIAACPLAGEGGLSGVPSCPI